MATLNTRIKNRYDSLGEWQKPGVELLPGEIALVSVLTRQVDETTGETIDVPAVLMKIGDAWGEGEKEGKEAGTLKTFEELPWLSAKASDVYDWAKLAAPENIPVIYSDDTATYETTLGSALSNLANDIYDHDNRLTGAVGELNARASVIENEYLRTSTNVDTGVTKMYLGKYGTDEIIFDCGGAILNALITEGILAGASFTEVELNGSKYIKSSPFTISELGEYTYDIQVSNPSAYSMTFVDRSSWAADGPPCYALSAHESVSMGAGNYCLFISGMSDLSVADIISISLIKN